MHAMMRSEGGSTRRSVAAGLLACSFASVLPWRASAASPPTRIVSLDWTATAMLLSLGVAPVGVGDAGLYDIWVAEPPLLPGTQDVGLRDTPNPEAIAALAPDLILMSPLGAAARPLLERIAPVHEVSLQGEGDALDGAGHGLMALARLLGREARARDVITGSQALFGTLRRRLPEIPARPLLVIQFLDARFIRVYGRQSMPGSTLARLGLADAWTLPVNGWGFALIGAEKLAAYPDAGIVVIDPLPSGLSLAPDSASLWGNLPAVREGRVRRLPAVWTFGEITAANRLAGFLVAQLAPGGADARL